MRVPNRHTKTQQRREAQYRAQLKVCGFRSWRAANRRRGELIDRQIAGGATENEIVELAGLQRLADLYVAWQTNDSTGRMNRKLELTLKSWGLRPV